MLYKDHGDWGSYEGDVDAAGNRQGRGKMVYQSGNSYEGGFVDDKFECDKGIYHWIDGDEYQGAWKEGERHGKACFKNADGTVEYSEYELGEPKGEGVKLSTDRKTAHTLLDGTIKLEILVEEAQSIIKDKFNMDMPEPHDPRALSTAAAAAPASKKNTGFFRSLFANRKLGPNGKMMYKDHGDWGAYEGEVDAVGNRTGQGKMTYQSGNSYEGGFLDDKFHGDKGVYRWTNGDQYEGSWKEGERHGKACFTNADGSVEFSMYDNGDPKGEGLLWSPDRATAHKMLNGKKQTEISVIMAADLAKEKFDMAVPAPFTAVMPSSSGTQSNKKTGLFGSLFANRRVGPDGKMLFRDNGEWGSFDGEVDVAGNRQGSGKMTYKVGNYYEGGFVDDKFQGNKGIYRWADGEEYEGSWKDGERHGKGCFRSADGIVEFSQYEQGQAKGEGVKLSAERKAAHKLLDGETKLEILVEEAKSIIKDKFGMPFPEPFTPSPSQATLLPASPASNKKAGLLGRFFSTRKIGKDGKMLFKDHGEWGSFEGDVDASGNRSGQGKMSYVSGNYFQGGFVNDKFHCEKGVYHWVDGDEYDGAWENGERHGKGCFKLADGTVEYSGYIHGEQKGYGVSWSADRKTAHKLLDGDKHSKISLAEAEKLAKETFDLPVPTRKTGFFRSFFPNKKVGPDGKLLFKDYDEWGSYEGDVDGAGERQGEGKMTYHSGNYYEGGFVDGKFECDKGVYRWADGDEYEGSWKAGERFDKGMFTNADGTVFYSEYKDGEAKGDGVWWSADRKTAHSLLDGVKKLELFTEEAEAFAKEKFNRSIPDVLAPRSPTSTVVAPASFFGRLFQSGGNHGKMRFTDHGDVGSYDGEFDTTGKLRHGEGEIVYDSGNFYKGPF